MLCKYIIFLKIYFIIFSYDVFSSEYNINKLSNFNNPWGMAFINSTELLITEKNGGLKLFDLKTFQSKDIEHNLRYITNGQGGILDIIFNNGFIYISYSEDRGNGKTSTSIARGVLKKRKVKLNNIFRAEPPIESGYHFGSRMQIKGEYLYASIGERGKGMIAQDYTMHPGSIIRIKLNGEIPNDNPKYTNKNNWLPEIFQIGVRNPQGMTLSEFDNEIYITNHGAKGGDWFGKIKKAGNYGWKNLGWGGKNYIGTKIGPKWLKGYNKAINYWVPSIGISSLVIYKGNEFKELNGLAIIAALKDQSLRSIEFDNDNIIKERIIFRKKIGRVRDIEVHPKNGKILMLSDEALWEMSNKN